MPFTNDDLEILSTINIDDIDFGFEDTTDYSEFDMELANLKANYDLTLTQTGEVIHTNTDWNNPDLQLAVSVESVPVAWPVNPTTGLPFTGDFTLVYRLRMTIADIPIASIESGTQGIIRVPKVLIDPFVPVAGMTIVSSGNSEAANNGTFVIFAVEEDGSEYAIMVTGFPLVDESGTPGAELALYFDYTKTFNYCYKKATKPEVSISMSHSCATGKLVSTDNTALGVPVSDVLTHTFIYPSALGDSQPPNIVTTTKTIIVGPPIYTGTNVTIIKHELVYLQTDGLQVAYSITGQKEYDLLCFDPCCFVTSIGELYNKAKTEKAGISSSGYTIGLIKAVSLLNLIEKNYNNCDDPDLANSQVFELKNLLKSFGLGCTCGDSETTQPQAINPSSGSYMSASNVLIQTIVGLESENVQDALAELLSIIKTSDVTTLYYSTEYYSGEDTVLNIDVPGNYLGDNQYFLVSGYFDGGANAFLRAKVGSIIHSLTFDDDGAYFEIYVRRSGTTLSIDSGVLGYGGTNASGPIASGTVDMTEDFVLALEITGGPGAMSGISVKRYNV